MRLISVQGHDGDNVGDLASCPLEYFEFPFQTSRVNLVDVAPRFDSWLESLQDTHLLVGGGGQLIFGDLLARLGPLKTDGLKICWGIGHNQHGAQEIGGYPGYLSNYDLVGLRDYCSPYRWVPCVSCISELFDNAPSPDHDLVVYEHKDRPLNIPGLPAQKNDGALLARSIEFLSSGRVILTNSYHGAYWGLLLGRCVLVVEPFSTKFVTIHPDVATTSLENWAENLGQATQVPGFLALCRETNLLFYRLVLNSLTDSSTRGALSVLPQKTPWLQRLSRRLLR